MTKTAKEPAVPKLNFDKENRTRKNGQSTTNQAIRESKGKDIRKGKDDSKPKTTKQMQQVKPKHGYCEICDVFYTELRLHTKSQSHEKVVARKNYWSTLDDVINALPTLDSLIENINKNQMLQESHVSKSEQSFSTCKESPTDDLKSQETLQNNCDKGHSKSTVCDNKGKVNSVSQQEETPENEVQNAELEMLSSERLSKCIDSSSMHHNQSGASSGLKSVREASQKSVTVETVPISVKRYSEQHGIRENSSCGNKVSPVLIQHKSETHPVAALSSKGLHTVDSGTILRDTPITKLGVGIRSGETRNNGKYIPMQ